MNLSKINELHTDRHQQATPAISNEFEPTYLIPSVDTVNVKPVKVKCYPKRPCRRTAICQRCAAAHREYLVFMGTRYLLENDIDGFALLSWPMDKIDPDAGPWDSRFDLDRAMKLCSPSFTAYIRTLAIGESGTLHAHILAPQAEWSGFLKAVRKLNLRKQPIQHLKPIFDRPGAMGYLFDGNYLPTLKRNDRPLGTRLLTASRGLICGFPKRPQWLEYERRLKEFDDQTFIKTPSDERTSILHNDLSAIILSEPKLALESVGQ